ncbi:hypothetical protein JXA48_04435 [Candidatus Woesearchaeota archaeon]|nr:hypothetical protein [Candidatus Woesearchaeota archaeon]
MGSLITAFLIITLIFILSALPLYFAVKLFGGKTKLWKTIIINILAGLVVLIINALFPLIGGIVAFVIILFMYMYFFRIGFLRAVLVWLLEVVLVVIFWIIGIILGISVLAGMILL